MKDLSIGMFDSGVGGLTVLKEVKNLLPKENILYLGDTARVPYGNRSPQTIIRYAIESALFLLTKGIKLLIIACNTSSAIALKILSKKLPIPVLGVIEPAAKSAVVATKNKKIGIIGTKATIKSMAYENAIREIDPHMEVLSKPCPLFVPIVEEGLDKDEVAFIMAEKYLNEFKASGIDTLIMGCTHYPVLEDVIKNVVGDHVNIINTGKETARDVEACLRERKLLKTKGMGTCKYYVTDDPDTFKEIGGRFLGYTVSPVKYIKSLDYKDFILH
ncbi:MAG TPA: glutamate racemase [Syntrophorhabdaceae bacterium]|nr:glutamate racemase [Syntrophorhabdaceae bacterium]HPU29058.1 glutamate racemase [Syntrophorhabdaceae bacterium]